MRDISQRTAERLAIANLMVQTGIIVTGGAVRLTGSGLGCDTWPQCQPGSFTPVQHAASPLHQAIEFGNRLLTFVLLIVAVAVLVSVFSSQIQCRRSLVAMAAMPLIGTLAQAVVGGITVLLDLHPAIVGVHFLISLMLVSASLVYLIMLRSGPDRRPAVLPPDNALRVGRAIAWLLGMTGTAMFVLGVIVTGAGPHSGDAEQAQRLAVDPQRFSWLHADVVIAYVGLLITMLVVALLTNWPSRVTWWARMAIAAAFVQGVIGYTQYFLELPRVLVALHMLGSAIVCMTVTGLILAIRDTRH